MLSPSLIVLAAVFAQEPAGEAPVASPSPAPALDSSATAPREIYEVHLAVDIPITVVGGGLGLARELFKDRFARITCPCDASKLNAIDRGTVGNHSHVASVAADVTAYGVFAVVPVLDAIDLGGHRALAEDLMIYAETMAVDTGLQNAVNFAVARPRPLAYARDPAYVNAAEGYLSFYAGHVATTFAALSAASYTIRRRYGEHVWPWIVTGLVGASVAFERVASGHHFPTDVTVGAFAGTAIGIGVPWLHARTREAHVAVAPISVSAGGGLGLIGAF